MYEHAASAAAAGGGAGARAGQPRSWANTSSPRYCAGILLPHRHRSLVKAGIEERPRGRNDHLLLCSIWTQTERAQTSGHFFSSTANHMKNHSASAQHSYTQTNQRPAETSRHSALGFVSPAKLPRLCSLYAQDATVPPRGTNHGFHARFLPVVTGFVYKAAVEDAQPKASLPLGTFGPVWYPLPGRDWAVPQASCFLEQHFCATADARPELRVSLRDDQNRPDIRLPPSSAQRPKPTSSLSLTETVSISLTLNTSPNGIPVLFHEGSLYYVLGKPPVFLEHSLSPLQGEKVDFQMLLLGKAKFLGLQRVPGAVETEVSLPEGCVPCDSLPSRNGGDVKGEGKGKTAASMRLLGCIFLAL